MIRENARHRQRIRLAIEAYELWGKKRPRRWMCKMGGLWPAMGTQVKEMNEEYKAIVKATAAALKVNSDDT